MTKSGYLYILIDGVEKRHYGIYANERTAREKAWVFEQINNLPSGRIDIYEIPEWQVHAE